MMTILHNLSKELKSDNIILKKDEQEHVPHKQKKEPEKFKKIDEKDEIQFSILKENIFESENENIGKINNDLEISVVGQGKIEEKERDVLTIKSLIKSCETDIQYLNDIIHRYKNSTKDFIMKSMVVDNNSMVFIDKNESQENSEIDDTEKKIKYFDDINNEFVCLKKKLEDLLSLYKTEKDLTEIKKNELEKLEKLKTEYESLKIKKHSSKHIKSL